LDEEGGGIDKAGENVRGDTACDGVLGNTREVSIHVSRGAEFAPRAEKIGDVAGVEGLLVEEAAFAIGVEEAKVFVSWRFRQTARAAVGERELAEVR